MAMSDIQAESAQSPHATSERQARFDIGWSVLLLLLAGGAVLGGGNFLYPYLAARNPLLIWNAAIGLPLGTAAIGLSLSQRVTISRPRWIVPGVLGATLAVQLAAQSWWPNSADEYGYVFLARTLLHGRLWNPPPPAPQIFEIAWTFTRHHEWFSQYPPAFPVLLMPFLAAGLPWLINPLLTMLLASLTSHGLRRSGVRADLAWPLLFLLMFSPFVLFNGASLFSHTLSAALVMGIVLLQAR